MGAQLGPQGLSFRDGTRPLRVESSEETLSASLSSIVAVRRIRPAPKYDLQDDGLEPSLVHPVDFLLAVPFVFQKGSNRGCDRVDERDHVAQGNDRGRFHAISLVLLCPMVAKCNFVLVVQPRLVVVPLAGVANPLPEPLANPFQIASDRLSVGTGEVCQQVRVRSDEAVPEVEDVLDLVAEDCSACRKASRSVSVNRSVVSSKPRSSRESSERSRSAAP